MEQYSKSMCFNVQISSWDKDKLGHFFLSIFSHFMELVSTHILFSVLQLGILHSKRREKPKR